MQPMPDDVDIVIAGDVASMEKIEELAKEIWNEHYRSIISQEQIDYMLKNYQSAEAIEEQIDKGYMYYLILDLEGREIGYLSYILRDKELFLSKLYLKKEKRGRGYGRQAIEFIEHIARQHNISLVTLHVNINNPSVEAYKKLGFTVARSMITEIGAGFIMDDYAMEKQVEA